MRARAAVAPGERPDEEEDWEREMRLEEEAIEERREEGMESMAAAGLGAEVDTESCLLALNKQCQ